MGRSITTQTTTRIAATVAVLALVLIPVPAVRGAATIVVNTGTDHAASGGECSGVANDCALRQAIDKAASGDTIQIPAGVPVSDVTLGVITIASKNLTITGAGADKTKIDAHAASGMFTTTGGSNFSISGLTLTRGNSQFGALLNSDGGAVSFSGVIATQNTSGGSNTAGFGLINYQTTSPGTLKISDSQFTANTIGGGGASGSGFGVVNFNSTQSSSMTVRNSTFSGNTIGGGSGPGFGVLDVSGSGTQNLTVTGSTLTSNTIGGTNSSGFGAVDFNPAGAGSRLKVTGSTLNQNHVGGDGSGSGGNSGSGIGGGLLASIPANGDLTIDHSSFSGNVLGGAGAAGNNSGSGIGAGLSVSLSAGSTMTITDSAADGNRAGGAGAVGTNSGSGIGGGISISATGADIAVTVARSSFSSNVLGGNGGSGVNSGSGIGGGIVWAPSSDSDQLQITNSTISGNTTGGAAGAGTNSGNGLGGGLELSSLGTIAVLNSTIAGNLANSGSAGGAGILGNANNVTITGSVIAGNLLGATESNCSQAFTSGGYNVEHGTSCGLAGTGDLNADPALGALADNGGPTKTQAPGAASPAIDHIPASACTAVTTDQRGVARPQGAGCDAGAYERAPAAATTGAVSDLTQTSATISGTASNADLRNGTVLFEYGTTTAYGTQTTAQGLPAGAAGKAYSAALTGLAPGTTYHYRTVATAPDGSATGSDGTFTTASPPPPPAKPVLGPVSIAPSKVLPFTGAGASIAAKVKRGATVSYTDSQAATTTFTVQRAKSGYRSGKRCVAKKPTSGKPRRCTRYVTAGAFTHADKAGANRFAFTGRVGGKRLAVGRYRLRAQARNAAGGRSAIRTAAFRIIR